MRIDEPRRWCDEALAALACRGRISPAFTRGCARTRILAGVYRRRAIRMRVAINGAGIAGPTLAWWLQRAGHEVILVERAPAVREGGYVVDFWGLGYDIAEKMGLVPDLRALGYPVREVRYVDAHGRRRGGFDVEVFRHLTHDRFTSLRRSDLAATIFGALGDAVETRFGDSIASIEDGPGGARVHFERGDARDVDVVVGADGLHSRVRALAFGADDVAEVSLGYHVAAFDVIGYRPRDELTYVSHGVAGRQVSRFAMRDDHTLFLFVFADEHLREREPSDDAERKRVLTNVFADVGWECPAILDAMAGADEVYFDRVSQIRMPAWTKGRVALLGDAAACVSLLAGEGTGLAMAEAYVLAGELDRCGGDVAAAFARYEGLLRPFLATKQATAVRLASSFAPKTALGVRVRDRVTRLLRIPAIADWFIGRDLRDDLVLPDYR
jgi:2-polyprenyl-6-methoxyphenol hydroxylase-like FAD-dependent oxidoreductase